MSNCPACGRNLALVGRIHKCVTEKIVGVTDNPIAPTITVTGLRGRGRPRKPDALSNADRQRAYRQRQKAANV